MASRRPATSSRSVARRVAAMTQLVPPDLAEINERLAKIKP